MKGVKSGEILLNSEFLAPGQSPSVYIGDSQHDPVGDDSAEPGRPGSKKSGNLAGKQSGNLGDADGPVLIVDLIKAQNLIKADIIGKSDPYAVLKYGDQKDKTKIAKNTQNPNWNHRSEFDLDVEDNENLM